MLLSGPWSNRAFSPFPTLLHFEKSKLGRSVKSGCCAFHNSTALITTTSFIVVENDQTTVVVSMRMMFVEKKGACPMAPACRESSSEFRAFPQVLRVLWALYFAKKRVQYDSGRRAAKEPG
jgi:hypothetical protein